MKIVGGVILAVLVVFGVGACSAGVWAKNAYNDLVSQSEAVDSQIGQVQNVYQRRNDLLPNVAKTVSAYAKHEKGVFVGVAEMRAKVGQTNINLAGQNLTAENLAKFQQMQGEIGSFLSRLMVVSERYPELQASGLFRDLQTQVEGAENRIAVERKKYNEIAQGYNTKLKRFPGNLVAGYFSFKEKPYFQAEKGADKVPVLNFGDEPAEKR